MEGELGRTANQTQHCRCLWEGGVKSNPTVALTLGSLCALEGVIQRCRPLQLGSTQRFDMEERGVRVVSNPTVPFTLPLGG